MTDPIKEAVRPVIPRTVSPDLTDVEVGIVIDCMIFAMTVPQIVWDETKCYTEGLKWYTQRGFPTLPRPTYVAKGRELEENARASKIKAVARGHVVDLYPDYVESVAVELAIKSIGENKMYREYYAD